MLLNLRSNFVLSAQWWEQSPLQWFYELIKDKSVTGKVTKFMGKFTQIMGVAFERGIEVLEYLQEHEYGSRLGDILFVVACFICVRVVIDML